MNTPKNLGELLRDTLNNTKSKPKMTPTNSDANFTLEFKTVVSMVEDEINLLRQCIIGEMTGTQQPVISLIRLVRDNHGIGLKEAKDAVDAARQKYRGNAMLLFTFEQRKQAIKQFLEYCVAEKYLPLELHQCVINAYYLTRD